MNRINLNIVDVNSVCEQCGIYALCLPAGLESGDLNMLDNIIKRRRPLERGQYLYRKGDPFNAIFALRSGSIKTFVMNEEGEEHIVGIKMPGDLLGLSDINNPQYTRYTKALETSSICEIPFERLEEIARKMPNLNHHILSMMSRELHQEQDRITICTKLSADARLAGLLLTLSGRFAQRGYSATDFNLSMSRSDIANILGLAVETVSRLFTQFQEQGILRVERKHIQLLDLDTLQQMVSHSK